MTRSAWRLNDEHKWLATEYGGATNRVAMPDGPLTCYGCGRIEDEQFVAFAEMIPLRREQFVTFGAMIPMRHIETGEEWTLFLCDDCWATAALENGRLSDLWDTITDPAEWFSNEPLSEADLHLYRPR